MILFVNNKNEIKDVNTTKDTSLRPYEIADSDLNPFANWSAAKICCYKVALTPEKVDGAETGKYFISMMTPYIDSRIIEHIEQLGNQNENNAAAVLETQDALCESSMNVEERFTMSDERFLELETALCDLSTILLSE